MPNDALEADVTLVEGDVATYRERVLAWLDGHARGRVFFEKRL